MPMIHRCTVRLTAALLIMLAMPGLAQDWPGFQGSNRDGVVPEASILTDWPDQGPSVLWSQDVGAGFGGAAIKDNTVYILDRNDTVGDIIKAFDLATGQPGLSVDYEAPGRISYHGSRSTPMVTDKHIFTVGPFGHVTCLDLTTQQIAWQKHMDDFGANPPKWAWSQSPLVYKDWIIIAPMAKDAGLVALDQATGKIAWKSGDIGAEGYGSPRLVTLAGKQQIVYFTSTLVTGSDPDTGKTLWSYGGIPVKRAIPTPAVVGDGRLFITAGYNAGSALIEIESQGEKFVVNEIKRDRDHGGQVHSALPVGEHLYVNLNTNENLRRRGASAHGIGCFDANGDLLWLSDNKPDINRGPILALGKHLLTLGGEDGVLRLTQTNAEGYKELASAKIFPADESKNMIWAPMAYANGRLLIRSQNQLKCLDLRADQPASQ